jgi:hypothetical protein
MVGANRLVQIDTVVNFIPIILGFLINNVIKTCWYQNSNSNPRIPISMTIDDGNVDG